MDQMGHTTVKDLDALWARHHAEWRDCAQIASQWREAEKFDRKLLYHIVEGAWWETLADVGVTLLIAREYEHLMMAMRVSHAGPHLTYMPLPHPSGLVVDHEKNVVHVASTRNPNQIYELRPVTELTARLDVQTERLNDRPLVPVCSRFYPGCLYLHDLAIINGDLYANAVGQNAIVRLYDDGRYERVWWPCCIETDNGPVFGQNHIQLNSIAAGSNLAGSYFSASIDKVLNLRPGDAKFPVDKRGVLFSGATRDVVVRGLTRPHSARINHGNIWVLNSGYGEFGFAADGKFVPLTRLPGWTRGLCFVGHVAFIGTSRIIPRFRQYAPGLDLDSSLCGIHAVDIKSGRVLGSLIWPYGNQIFAVEYANNQTITGFPFAADTKRATDREKKIFYTFSTAIPREGNSK